MLEEKIREFKTGYRIHNELMKLKAKKITSITPEVEMANSRNAAFCRSATSYEEKGYLASISINWIKHPLISFKIYYTK